MPHCPLALISSSASTTSSAPKCRPAPGTWCPTALQPLFLRRGAPRPPPQNADRPRGRGASLPSSPYFFVEEHHVLRLKMPTGSGAWCLTALQPLFLRREAPRPAPHFPDRAGGVVPHPSPALIPSSAGTTSGGSSTRPASHAAGYCKISIILDKCVLKGNFFYGIISIRRYSI